MNPIPVMKNRAMTVALTLVFSPPAWSQVTPQPPEEKLERVEVTGSSIKRTAAESAGSVQVLTREDIERTGESTALGILTSVAGVGSSLSSATTGSGGFATGASAVNLRNLGKVATLVLVNGRRIAPYGLSDGAQDNFTNLDAIATEAIDRIEILKDGASAIYGSDAIAGVINIILRKHFEGAKIGVNYREADGFHDLRNRSVKAIFGYGDMEKQGFNTYLSVEGYKSDGYSTGDLASHYPAWHRLTPGRSTWDAKSAYSPTGNYFRSSTNIVAAPGCPTEAVDATDQQCKWDALQYSGLTTNNKRYAAASSTHFTIGGDINANLELTTAGATTDYIVAPFSSNNGSSTTSTSIWYNVYGAAMVGPFSYPKLPVGHASNPYTVPVEYRARLMDTGNGFNFNRTKSEQSRLMLALDGTLGAYDWKSAAGYMESTANKATRSVSAKGYTDAIVNNVYKFGQQNDAALLDTMFPVRTTDGKSTISFIDGTVSGQVAQLPAGPLSVALGADLRREGYEMKSSDNVLNGELVGIFGLQVKDRVDHYALFAEATIPLLTRLELSAALRADKTSNSEAHVSPKLGLRYNVTDRLLLRATASGGFRAPNIIESGNGLGRSSVAGSVNDLRRCPIATALNNLIQNSSSATTGDKALGNSYRASDCAASMPSFVASNADLKPETSRSLTGGLVFEPVRNWTMAIDYFQIERKDEIGTRSIADILKGEATLPAGQLLRVDNSATDNEFLALVSKYAPGNTTAFGGIGKLGLVYNPYVNTGKTRASGFDFDAGGRFTVKDVGEVKIKLEGIYNWKYQVFSVADNAYAANTRGNYDGGSRLQLKLRTSLKSGAWNHGATLNYRSGYSNNNAASPTYCVTQNVAAENMAACARVGSNTTVDYNLAYTGIKHVKLSLYVDNVFQQDAPVSWRDGWSPQFRMIGASAAYIF